MAEPVCPGCGRRFMRTRKITMEVRTEVKRLYYVLNLKQTRGGALTGLSQSTVSKICSGAL